jgi:hypothetical protein
MELRFAGEGSDLGALIEREMAIAQELDLLKEGMRLRSKRLSTGWSGMNVSQGWDGTEPSWANGA